MTPTYETYERINKVIDYINSGEINNLEVGKHDISEGIFVNVMEYDTIPEGTYEAHKKYIDIHYMIDGIEAIEICDVKDMNVEIPYNEEKDVEKGTGIGKRYVIKKGQFVITMPTQAHMPKLLVEKSAHVKKACFKILL